MDKVSIEYAPIQSNLLGRRCEDVRLETLDFCETRVRPELCGIARDHKIPDHLLEDLKRTGWFGLLIGRQYGGQGRDCLARVINVEHLARECPDLGAILQIAQLGTGSILEFGSEEQKRKWLPALACGDRICTIAITESHSG